MRIYISLLVLLIAVPSFAQGIYKWVDEQGQVHYTDTPQENSGAEEVELQPLQTFSAPEITVSDSDSADDSKEAASYKLLEISSPSMEETIWNTGGLVTATARLQPSLQMGHTIRVLMDGNPVGTLTGAGSLQMSGVERGEHQLQMEVLDENGASLISASPVTFFYQQTSVNRIPANGPRPR